MYYEPIYVRMAHSPGDLNGRLSNPVTWAPRKSGDFYGHLWNCKVVESVTSEGKVPVLFKL